MVTTLAFHMASRAFLLSASESESESLVFSSWCIRTLVNVISKERMDFEQRNDGLPVIYTNMTHSWYVFQNMSKINLRGRKQHTWYFVTWNHGIGCFYGEDQGSEEGRMKGIILFGAMIKGMEFRLDFVSEKWNMWWFFSIETCLVFCFHPLPILVDSRLLLTCHLFWDSFHPLLYSGSFCKVIPCFPRCVFSTAQI